MTWSAETSHGDESAKIRWEIAEYTRGRVLDLGCGTNKCYPHFIGVDNGHHAQFGMRIKPDVFVKDCAKLDLFASQSMDAVYSSHLLEHFEYEKVPGILKEWLRVVKPGGYLILYVPDEDEYPKVGDPHANPDHKWNVNYERTAEAMREAGSWDLIDFQKRNADDEYSLLFIFKRLVTSKPTHLFSHKNPKPTKTACVFRTAAFGDLMQASSVFAGLKKAGYHVTVYASPPGSGVIEHDPNIDRLLLLDKDQVPNQALGPFWRHQAKKYDKFINLSESVEGAHLALPGRAPYEWPVEMRRKHMDRNYVEFQHELAGIPFDPQVRFYASDEEKAWARKQRARMGPFVVLWSLAGSSVHKHWPYMDQIMARMFLQCPQAHIVLVGGEECQILEQGWEKEPRVHRHCGDWTIRQSLAFIDEADLVIGPETGVMNAAAMRPVPKILFLSHSSKNQLSRDWVNCASMSPSQKDVPCWPCHKLIYNWSQCVKDEEAGAALCQSKISADAVWAEVEKVLMKKFERAA